MRRTGSRARAETARGAAGSTAKAATARQAFDDRAADRPRRPEDRRTEPPPSLHSALARSCHPRYKRPMRSVLVAGMAVALGAAACKKESAAPGPSVPASTAHQDALWSLAPEGVQLGVVASPRGVAMIERAALALETWLDAAPEFAELRE